MNQMKISEHRQRLNRRPNPKSSPRCEARVCFVVPKDSTQQPRGGVKFIFKSFTQRSLEWLLVGVRPSSVQSGGVELTELLIAIAQLSDSDKSSLLTQSQLTTAILRAIEVSWHGKVVSPGISGLSSRAVIVLSG